MNVISFITNNLGVIACSLLLGLIVPVGVIVGLIFSPKRKDVPFVAAVYGFVVFLGSLFAVAILSLLIAQTFLPSVTLNAEGDADRYIFIGGGIVLSLFYLCAEGAKLFIFRHLMRGERNALVGLPYGCGFIFAQNLLIFGLIYAQDMDLSQALAFGILMLLSGIIYILISLIGYQLMADRFRYIGAALALSYYLMFAVMLIIANVYVTYSFIAVVLLFNLIMGYALLPLKFKRRKAE